MELPKELIPDANILFSFFKTDSVRRHTVEELKNRGCKLISPDFVLEEIQSNKDKIIKFSEISESKFMFVLSSLKEEIETKAESEYKEFLTKANKLSPHDEDTKDDPYFALSLALNKTPIWSDEEAFKQQSKIKVFSTKDLLDLLSKIEEVKSKESRKEE